MNRTRLLALQHPKVTGGEGVQPRLLVDETFLGREWWGKGRGWRRGSDEELTTDIQRQAGKIDVSQQGQPGRAARTRWH